MPIGLGSGISGMIAMRDAPAVETKVVGVVPRPARPPMPCRSRPEKPGAHSTAPSPVADGLAGAHPTPGGGDHAQRGGAEWSLSLTTKSRAAMSPLLHATPKGNLAEGAGAAPLGGFAAGTPQHGGQEGRGSIPTGGNVDRPRSTRPPGQRRSRGLSTFMPELLVKCRKNPHSDAPLKTATSRPAPRP